MTSWCRHLYLSPVSMYVDVYLFLCGFRRVSLVGYLRVCILAPKNVRISMSEYGYLCMGLYVVNMCV